MIEGPVPSVFTFAGTTILSTIWPPSRGAAARVFESIQKVLPASATMQTVMAAMTVFLMTTIIAAYLSVREDGHPLAPGVRDRTGWLG